MEEQITNEAKKWFEKTWGIIFLLIVFFPLGLFAMWKYAGWSKKVKWSVTVLVLITLAIGSVINGGDKVKVTSKAETSTSPAAQSPTPTPAEEFNIQVTSQIVKKVDGKYRYFFDIRNHDSKPFEGSVTIELFKSKSKSSLAGDTFNTTKVIKPNLGTSVYTDANTGPTSVHGANGLIKFTYVVKKDGKEVNSGEGQITDKLEDLSI